VGIRIIGGLSAVALLLAGCSQEPGSSDTQSPTAQTIESSAGSSGVAPPATDTVTSSATAEQAVDRRFQAEAGLAILGHFLTDHPDHEDQDSSVSGVGSFSVPGQEPVLVDAQVMFPDREVITQMYTSAGTAAEPIIVGAIQSRVPAQGLDEEKFKTSVVSLDPLTLEILQEIEALSFEGWDKPAAALIGGEGSVVTLQHSEQAANIKEDPYADIVVYATGYDVLSGERVWRKELGSAYDQLGALATINLTGKVHGQYDHPCSAVDVLNTATGEVLISRDQLELSDHCGGSIDVEKIGSKFMRISADIKTLKIDASTGQQVHFPTRVVHVDEDQLIAGGLRGYEGEDDYTLDFMDMKNGKILWTLPASKVRNLNASLKAIHEGVAYISTTDATISVDARTGEGIEDIVTEWPYASVAGWSYWTDGTLTRSD
jgi:hypothetical protein